MKSWPESEFGVVPACFPENPLCSAGHALCCVCLVWAVKAADTYHPRVLHAIIGQSLCTVNQCMAFKCFEIPLGRRELT